MLLLSRKVSMIVDLLKKMVVLANFVEKVV